MPSKSRSTENPRAAKSREATLAAKANAFARTGTRPAFGAPVSATQVAQYTDALKALRKGKTLAQFLGFKSGDAAKRALAPVAKGDKPSTSLDPKYRDAVRKLHLKLDSIAATNGTVNKTWPRKHAIVLHALLSEQPTRKPRAAKPKPASETPAPAQEVSAA